MDTIYSKIIWDELGSTDEKFKCGNFKIHTQEPGVVDKLVIDWVKEAPFEKVEEVLSELSWIRKTTFETYYDGPFYGFSQRDEETLDKIVGTYKCDMLIHDMGMFPSILDMAIRTRMAPDELRFMADVLEAFQSRIPKVEGCSINSHNWGYKVEEGKEVTDEEETKTEE